MWVTFIRLSSWFYSGSEGISMRNIIEGINAPPWLVALVRGLLLAAATAAISFALSYFTSNAIPVEMTVYAPIIIYALRQLEGLLDQTKKPRANSVPIADIVPFSPIVAVRKDS